MTRRREIVGEIFAGLDAEDQARLVELVERCYHDPPVGADDGTVAGPAPGARVAHRTFGLGTVTRVEEGTVTVLFEDAGYRTLDGELVAEVLSPLPDT